MTQTGPRRVATIEAMSVEALRCHAWGHPWDKPPAVPFNWWGWAALLLVFRCPSCGSTRRDVRDRSNPRKMFTRLYQHSDDYLAAFPADRGDYVTEWFVRFDLPPDDVELDDWRVWSAA